MSIKYLSPSSGNKLNPLVRSTFKEMKSVMGGVVPDPIALHAIDSDLLLKDWTFFKNTVLTEYVVSRKIKEAISASVSFSNKCDYCVDIHTTFLMALGESPVVKAILENKVEEIQSTYLQNIINWSLNSQNPEVEIIKNPPFNFSTAPEIVGTVIAFQYTNRMVSIFCNEQFIPIKNPRGRDLFKKIVSWPLSYVLRKKQLYREVSDEVKLSKNSSTLWAQAVPQILSSFESFAQKIEHNAKVNLRSELINNIDEMINQWEGGSSSILLEDSFQYNTSMKIAFLTAFAPYKITEALITKFKLLYPKDEQLLALTSYTSYAVTQKISSWLQKPLLNRV